LSNINDIHKVTLAEQGIAYAKMMGILKDMPSFERLQLLKSVAGAYGHRVLPGLGFTQAYGVPPVGSRPKAPPQSRSRKPAMQVELEGQIRVLNEEIKSASKERGAKLPKDDPLFERRNEYFRELHEYKTRYDPSPTKEGDKDASDHESNTA
jgi:hypothetical protein